MGKPTLANVREQKVRPELVYVWFVYLDVHLFMFISTTLLDNSKKKDKYIQIRIQQTNKSCSNLAKNFHKTKN